MKAYVLRDIGSFGIEEVDQPVPGPDEVLVQVKAAGICGSDIPRIYYHGTYSYPLIPGHEYSGIVVETESAVAKEAYVSADPCDAGGGRCDSPAASWIGKRVGVFPLIPCGKCLPCRQQRYEMCRNYSYLGSRRDGGFAEYVSVPIWNLIELPEEVTFEQAAMMEPMAVAVHAMRKALQGEKSNASLRIAICGLGTIGLFLLMFLKEAGYEDILVIGNKDIQKEKAFALGISEGQFYDNRDGGADAWLEQCAREKGIDVFFECVGANETVNLAVNHTAPGGRVMLVGNPASDMILDRQIYWKILRNQLTLFGTWNSSFSNPFYDKGADLR
ncbi:MAG: galactitol-1-phosphate 5-dehydrogenase, partial [Lachnospiraceae bacterium]|nr:galactitol-1-phosphate 5-dehydrogenase [Lachnospiraceae bacterium]